jgi:ABC-type multidrug transport system fused ATPase/permease subunit
VARLLKEFAAAHPLATLALLVVLFAGNATLGLTVTAMGGVVDALSGVAHAGGHSVAFWLAIFIIAGVLEEFYWTFKNLISDYLRDQGAYQIQRRVLERAAAAPLLQFEEREFNDHLQRAASGMGERLARLYQAVVDLSQLLVMLGSIAVALALIQPLLLPLLAAGALPAVWLQARVATAIYRAQREHTTRERLRAHLQSLLTGREAAAELRIFGSATFLLGRWRRLRDDYSRDVLAAERRRAGAGTAGSLLSGGAYAAALVLVALLILRGRLSIGNYVTVAAGALSFSSLLGSFIGLLRSLEEQAQFLGDLFDFWSVARKETSLSDSPRAGPSRPRGTRSSTWARVRERGSTPRGLLVQAHDVTFRYPVSTRPVVQHIDLRIERGERVAIVGENGAGKTTLVKLLSGLYQPCTGSVSLDGASAVTARQRIAAVFQDYATFQLTARQNIGFGDLRRLDDDAALTTAAEQAAVADLLQGLPERFDTYLGRQFGETDLSGGQWQRIALARAFFRDADLLVLDEPTAALDPLAELALFQRFAALVEGRTAIMISHRLGMARLADRIIVLQDGAIVEEGRHDKLVAQGGVYARMFAAQAQWYR